MRSRLAALTLSAALILTTLPGCWDMRPTDRIAIVGSIALDEGSDGKVLVSVEIVNAHSLALGTGQASGQIPVVAWVFREEAITVFNALRNIEMRTSRRLFEGQANTIVFGQNLAAKGIGPYLDMFARQSQFRRTIDLNVCDTGAGLLQRPLIEDLPSRTLTGLTETAVFSGKTTQVTLNEFLKKLSSPGIEPITSHTAGRETEDLYVKRQGEVVRQENPSVDRQHPLESEERIAGRLPPESPVLDPLKEAGTGEAIGAITIIPGIAVFRGDVLRGFLDGEHARGYLWAVGRVKGGLLEILRPVEGLDVLNLAAIRVKSSVTPIIRGPRDISVRIEVSPLLEIAEMSQNISLSSTTVRRMERAANRAIKEEILTSLGIVQDEFQSDVYGFGQAVYRKDPKTWRLLEHDWNEGIFPYLDVKVTVNSKIRSSALVLKDP